MENSESKQLSLKLAQFILLRILVFTSTTCTVIAILQCFAGSLAREQILKFSFWFIFLIYLEDQQDTVTVCNHKSLVIIKHYSSRGKLIGNLAHSHRFLSPTGNFSYQPLLSLHMKGLFGMVLHEQSEVSKKFSPINNRHTRKPSFPPPHLSGKGEKGRTAKLACSYTLILYSAHIYIHTLNIFLTTWWWKLEILQSIPKTSCLIHVVMCGGNSPFSWQCVPVGALKANLIFLLASSLLISADVGPFSTSSWLGWGMARRVH